MGLLIQLGPRGEEAAVEPDSWASASASGLAHSALEHFRFFLSEIRAKIKGAGCGLALGGPLQYSPGI